MEQLNLDGIDDGLPSTTTTIDKENNFDNIFDSDISVVSLGSPLPADEPRRVSFASTVRVYSSQLSDIDETCWYSREELCNFERPLVEWLRIFEFTSRRQESRPMLALGVETRGLEGKFCYERQRRKFWSKRYIVGASQRKWPATRIADAALQLDKWASDLALEEGKRDYERAYENRFDDQEDITVPTSNSKRCHPELEDKERSVRQKVR